MQKRFTYNGRASLSEIYTLIMNNELAYHLPELTIYITDTCSMSCEGCITYNELAMTQGHLVCGGPALERMTQWSRLVQADRIFVIGGEPMSHPELSTWLDTVKQLWPRAQRYTIVTNGELLASMTEQVCGFMEQGWDFEISSHSKSAYQNTLAWWSDLAEQLEHKPRRYEEVVDGELTEYYWDHKGRPLLEIGLRDEFYPRRYTVHEDHIEWRELTNAGAQHNLCKGKACTHLVNGVMYRCPVQATIPRLAQQYRIEGTEGLADLDLGFDPLEGGNLSSWFASLGRSTKQCSLCDWNEKRVPLQDPYAKKIKIVRQPK